MSNSSDTPAGPDRHLQARVLAAIAWECSQLGNAIAELGASISSAEGLAFDPGIIVRLQDFDRLMQNAHAQAQILAHIAHDILLSRDGGAGMLLDHIHAIALHDVKERILASTGHRREAPAPVDDEDIWLTEPAVAS